MRGGFILNHLLLAWVTGALVPLSSPLLLTIVLWQSFLLVDFLRESDGDFGCDYRPIQGCGNEIVLCGEQGEGEGENLLCEQWCPSCLHLGVELVLCCCRYQDTGQRSYEDLGCQEERRGRKNMGWAS